MTTSIDEFIRRAAIEKAPIFDSYKKLCDLQGNQNLDYPDFEWKYYQAYHGKKTEQSPVKLSDLPIIVLEKVVQKLSLVDCFALRRVASNLRNLVDNTERHCELLKISPNSLNHSIPYILFDSQKLSYEKTADGGCKVHATRTSNDIGRNYKHSRCALQVMVADISTILANPKLKIDTFIIERVERSSKVWKVLKSLNSQLNVQKVEIDQGRESVLSVIQSLKPKCLEEIEIWTYKLRKKRIAKLVEMEQWKQAKVLCWGNNKKIPVEGLLNFKEIAITRFDFTHYELEWVRDILLKCVHLETGYFGTDAYNWVPSYNKLMESEENAARLSNLQQRVGRFLSKDSLYDAETGRFPIPNSRNYFKLEFQYCLSFHMKITKYQIN